MVKNSNIKGKFTLENLARDNTELLKLARHNTWKLDYKYKNQITKGKVQMRKNNASNYNLTEFFKKYTKKIQQLI